MITTTHLQDIDGGTLRDTRVPWKELRTSRRLRRWDSVPALKLVPLDRPRFICTRCGIANVLVAICPWCLSDAVESIAPCVEAKRRPRRISAPSLLSDAQKAQLRRIESRARTAQANSKCDVASTSLDARNHVSAPDGDTTARDHAGASSPTKSAYRRRRRQAAVYSATDVMATVTANAEFEPLRHLLGTLEELDSPSSQTSIPPSGPIDAMVLDGPHHASPVKDEHDTPPASTLQPSLRRKHRLALRQRSSCSLRRRATVSTLTSSPTQRRAEVVIPFCTPPPERSRTLRSTTGSLRSVASIDSVPLGHPQRPLYTAIRKNMFVPPIATLTEATPSISEADGASSFRGTLRTRPSRSLDIPRPSPAYDFGLDSGAYHPPPPPTHTEGARPSLSGCSLSGETELRMNLARSRSVDGVAEGYTFREVRRRSAVKGRVKNIGKGIRDLFLGRS